MWKKIKQNPNSLVFFIGKNTLDVLWKEKNLYRIGLQQNFYVKQFYSKYIVPDGSKENSYNPKCFQAQSLLAN